MKLGLLFSTFMIFMMMGGCASNQNVSQPQNTAPPKKYIEDAPRDRQLVLNGVVFSESDFGGVERWFAIDRYGKPSKVRFQVGCFKNGDGLGYVLYEGGTEGVAASCYRKGLDMRWDWDDYAIIIRPDGTCLYYDFSYQSKGVKPKEFYKASKF